MKELFLVDKQMFCDKLITQLQEVSENLRGVSYRKSYNRAFLKALLVYAEDEIGEALETVLDWSNDKL